jgi:hypothetical protein
LKHHQRSVGRKVSRGGAGKRDRKQIISGENDERNHHTGIRKMDWRDDIDTYWEDELMMSYDDHGEIYFEDESMEQQQQQQTMLPKRNNNNNTEKPKYLAGYCPICFEYKTDLLILMRNCRHPPACVHCLRELYIKQAQQNVQNYPLRCFDPSCTRLVRDTQVQQLARNQQEINQHYRLCVLQKSYKGTQQISHCPQCDHPYHVQRRPEQQHKIRSVRCRCCRTEYALLEGTDEMTTIYALESIVQDKVGINDGWCICPGCRLVISKGNGCDYMACPCGTHFSFSYRVQWQGQPKPPMVEIQSCLADGQQDRSFKNNTA